MNDNNRYSSDIISFDPIFRVYNPGLKSIELIFYNINIDDLINIIIQDIFIPKIDITLGIPSIIILINQEIIIEINIKGIKLLILVFSGNIL